MYECLNASPPQSHLDLAKEGVQKCVQSTSTSIEDIQICAEPSSVADKARNPLSGIVLDENPCIHSTRIFHDFKFATAGADCFQHKKLPRPNSSHLISASCANTRPTHNQPSNRRQRQVQLPIGLAPSAQIGPVRAEVSWQRAIAPYHEGCRPRKMAVFGQS